MRFVGRTRYDILDCMIYTYEFSYEDEVDMLKLASKKIDSIVIGSMLHQLKPGPVISTQRSQLPADWFKFHVSPSKSSRSKLVSSAPLLIV